MSSEPCGFARFDKHRNGRGAQEFEAFRAIGTGRMRE